MLQLSANASTTCPAKQPIRWPFPPRKPASPRSARVAQAMPRSRSRTRKVAASCQTSGMSRLAMAGDICLVAVWAAAIPGVMWLGTVAGF